jgi:hypothetical protein
MYLLTIDSGVEHLHQHERITVTGRSIKERAKAFHIEEKAPNVSHFIAGPFQSESRGRDDDTQRNTKIKAKSY